MVQGPGSGGWGAALGPAMRNPPKAPMDYIREPTSGKLYRRGKLLGKGAFGRCYKFTNMSNNHVYAVKIITQSRITQQRRRGKVEKEIEVHSRLMHKNIVDFHGHFQDEENVYMILEYCSHKTLAHILKARKVLTEPEVRYYLREIITGLAYLHQQSIIHRDLKLSNCFITKKMEVKIGDLGLATTKELAERTGSTVCGTPNYLAPEVIAKKGHSIKSDIWALGCIMYTLLAGISPFKCQPLRKMYQSISDGTYTTPDHISPDARSLIRRLLATNPLERPSLLEILGHRFFTQGYTPERLPPRCCHAVPDFATNGCLRKFFRKAATVLFRQVMSRDAPTVHILSKEPQGTQNNISCLRNSWRLSNSNMEAQAPVIEDTQSEVPTQMTLKPTQTTRNRDTWSTGETQTKSPEEKESKTPRETETNNQKERLRWIENWNPMNVLMAGTLNNSEADGSLQCMVGSVAKVLRCCLENMPQANQEPQEHSDCPILWVTKWVDYSNKYGFGYQLSDRCTGVLLRDGTHIALYPHLQRICYSTGSDGSISFPKRSSPSPLAMKIGILNFFSQYMDQRLLEGGDLHAVPCESISKLCLLHFMKSNHALLMVFSNGTVQVNFYHDHTKIVLSCQQGDFLLTYINQQRISSTVPLHAMILDGCPTWIRQRMQYMADLLQHL
ncbi:inactive serine/threonine-protein kinase PLK5 [Ambystoma mexicanum]|uniref:inactive serine/threonine-protein kinase PLK5 n=1 Tax=Ambystoma mexicanum TaxID=8296 RepID=UPI0037E79D26